jgi:hypothetical protein
VLQTAYFALCLLNSVALIAIFAVRGRRLDLVQRFGWLYLLLAIPAIYVLVLAWQERAVRYLVFLAIFLAFLAIEALYDWILKIPFRDQMDWRQLVPYVALYISSNYGFVVMTWRYDSSTRGILLLALFVVQILANFLTHSRHPDGPAGDRPSRDT